LNGHLSPQDRQRLARLLGMTGSAHDGEALNAARLADRLVKDRGATWPDVLIPLQREPLHSTWRRVCAELAARPDGHRPWERRFVTDLSKFPRLSSKQRCVLQEIAARVLGRPVA
jgi:hypothetical protein